MNDNRLEELIVSLGKFSKETFNNIYKSKLLNNKEFIAYRVQQSNKEHLIAENIIKNINYNYKEMNKNYHMVNNNFVTKLVENNYSVGMYCKYCSSSLNLYFCDCEDYLRTKLYCYHIHLLIILETNEKNILFKKNKTWVL